MTPSFVYVAPPLYIKKTIDACMDFCEFYLYVFIFYFPDIWLDKSSSCRSLILQILIGRDNEDQWGGRVDFLQWQQYMDLYGHHHVQPALLECGMYK